MPTTPTWLLRYPALTAAPNVPADIQALATDVETALAGGGFRTQTIANAAARPAAPYVGMTVYRSDLLLKETWNGVAWVPDVANSVDVQLTAYTGNHFVNGTANIGSGQGRKTITNGFAHANAYWVHGDNGTSFGTATAVHSQELPYPSSNLFDGAVVGTWAHTNDVNGPFSYGHLSYLASAGQARMMIASGAQYQAATSNQWRYHFQFNYVVG